MFRPFFVNQQLAVLFAALAAINAQYLAPSITTQNQNIYRTPYNLGQVSTHSKTIDTPFSSVSKSDVRVSNPGYTSYGGLGLAHGVAPLGVAHGYGAPVVAAHGLSPYGLSPYGLGRPAVAVARPGLAVARPVGVVGGVAPGLLGVAYSAAPAVAHMSYSNGLGISYAW